MCLSPAYDLVPSEALGGYPQLDFGQGPHLPAPATNEALEAAGEFGIGPTEAREINDRIAAALSDIQTIMNQAGMAPDDRRFLTQRLPSEFRRSDGE